MIDAKAITEAAQDIHAVASEHGWWEKPLSFGDIIALCHSELSEALEEYRNGKEYAYCNTRMINAHCDEGARNCVACLSGLQGIGLIKKPEGIAVELADCIIRILDYCGERGIDIGEIIRIKHEYNRTRPYRHGGKVM